MLTDEEVNVEGDTAWVTLDENIIQSVDEDSVPEGDLAPLAGARATAINVFVRESSLGSPRWAMVAHHSAPVG